MDDLAATDAERVRFLRARKGDLAAASSMLSKYLEWRKTTLPLPAEHPRLGAELPPWVMWHGQARDATPVVFIQGAMYDPDAGTIQQYANATAEVLDAGLPRDSLTKTTVLVDCRGEEGAQHYMC